MSQKPGQKADRLPDYLEQGEVEALIRRGEHGDAQLLMLVQWRAGLRVSEALALETRDLSLDGDQPTIRVRLGKGRRQRLVPVHAELHNELNAWRRHGRPKADAKLFGVTRRTASRWVERARDKAIAAGDLPYGKHVSTHTLRHSFARHMLANGVPINTLSLWLGHSSLQTTLIYLRLVPDSAGVMDGVP